MKILPSDQSWVMGNNSKSLILEFYGFDDNKRAHFLKNVLIFRMVMVMVNLGPLVRF
jgi:hypothetical protein